MPATTATRKPAPRAHKDSVDYLEAALKDLGRARDKGGEEIRSSIDSAMDQIRDATRELGSRGQDQVSEWQKTLEGAAADAACEFGRIAIRAQRSPEALTELSREIRKRRAQLTA